MARLIVTKQIVWMGASRIKAAGGW